ncbi:MAG: ribonuclease D [Pseudomonadota bacterium]
MPALTTVDLPDRIISRIDSHDPVALDTEFMRERTYFAQLCLVQLATPDEIFCMDPLAGDELGVFWERLGGRTWVIHSARQDIEVIYQASGRMPDALFDTQVAAGLLGFQAQIGYAGLVDELFDVQLPKSHTRADWSRRPLSDELLTYAAEDVEYLLRASDVLSERLDAKGRLDWARADSALLLDKSLYDIDAGAAVDRLKGARSLRGRRRVVAARLAEWREEEAVRLNRPRQWIVRDSILIDLAFKAPGNLRELGRIDELPDKVIKRSGKAILKAIASAAGDSHDYSPPSAPTEAQKSQLKAMQRRVAECADDLGIAAETIASRKDLSAIIADDGRDSKVLSGWRRELVGSDLLALV